MALDGTKWEVRTDKSIRYIGPTHGVADANYVTVLELHRWLQDLADDASVSDDDFLDITTVNPSDKKFDTIITLTNGYTLDDTESAGSWYPASEFIYGGSILQGSGGTEVIYDGIRVVANRGVYVNVIQNNAVLTNDFWNSQPDGESFIGLNPDPANGVAMQFMVKIRDSGANIDNAALLFTTREWGKTYSEFRIPSTGRGVNVVPLTYADDLNNTTASGTVATWTEITNVTEGFNLIDVDNNGTNEEYYSEWSRTDGGATYDYTINQFYERMKYLTRRGSAESLYGLTGPIFRGITHSVVYSGLANGNFVEGGATPVSWGAGATVGTGQILADDTTDTIIYIQQLTGSSPNGTLTQGGVTATVGTVTERTVSAPFCGASTGSAIVGAYGFSLESADLAVSDKIQALDGVTRQPPNNVTFTVNGVASGYRVLVGPEDGSGGLFYTQLSLTSTLNADGITTVQVDEALPANTPAVAGTTGGIRIQRDNGSYTLHRYTAISTSPTVFTIPSADFSGAGLATAGNNVFITYIDAAASAASISYNTIQTTTQTLFIEARFGGTGPTYADSIKPAKTTGTLGSTGGSATLSTVSDA